MRDVAMESDTEIAPLDDGTFSLPATSVPSLLEVSWELSGVTLTAEADVVAQHYCGLDAVRAYRPDYELGKASDDAVFAARARAEQVIEEECKRALQPVLRIGFADRPCAIKTRGMVVGDSGYDPCLVRTVAAYSASGKPVNVPTVGNGPYIDLTNVAFGDAARIAYVTGMAHIPSEAPAAVAALASWYLAPKTAPENATSTSTDLGVMSFVIAGVQGAATSIPEVNALIARYRLNAPSVI